MNKLLAFASLLLASACLEGDPNPYAQQSMSSGGTSGSMSLTPGTACSQMTSAAVSLSLNNRSPYVLRVLWVDYACQEVDYGTLPPNQTFTTSTLATHPWRLREQNSNALVFEYVTGTNPAQSVDVQVP